MTDHEETIKQAKGHGRNREKVHRSNGFAMIAKKRDHRFAGSGFLGAGRIQREMVLSETSNPSIKSSPWILGEPQVGFSSTILKIRSRASLEIRFRPITPPSFGDRTPVKGKPLPVPTDHSIWSYDGQSLFPAWPDSSRENPKKFIDHSNLWSRMLALEHGELLPENQVFQ
jgi:hypothetical protein